MSAKPPNGVSIGGDFAEYISTMWFIGWGTHDWMGTLYKRPNDDRWHTRYRFRYYAREGEPFKSGTPKRAGWPAAPPGRSLPERSRITLLVRSRPGMAG